MSAITSTDNLSPNAAIPRDTVLIVIAAPARVGLCHGISAHQAAMESLVISNRGSSKKPLTAMSNNRLTD
ncbi:hypothetical protein FDV58_34120 [Bradyrhizobium elkanii]|uniref:Uncharacterized protein n=1 Tax=Bradyrhizobium elkanii TaxID=29448 RepID=A0A4U6RL12_BRAEL|nr:hypothetical protein [Bradyrhizobium elkanii]TKV74042.1 hypothetical protein FDV58_34120 [Bradyrhizobium elkanii]